MLPVRLEVRDKPTVAEKRIGVLGVLEEMAWGPMEQRGQPLVLPRS